MATEKHEIRRDGDRTCHACRSDLFTCSCGWNGCLYERGAAAKKHCDLRREQEYAELFPVKLEVG